MASSFHLLVALPDKEPISYDVNGESVTLGRSPVNDIQILVREISTAHCVFNQTESGYTIMDIGSTNGTKVNDRSVKEPVQLNNRDVILLGETIPSYFIIAEEGADIDLKSEIAEIENARTAPKKPTVKHLTAPGAVKKVGLPTKKPLVSAPLATATPAEGSNVGSATVKLAQSPPRPTTKLASPPVKKLAPPGAPPAPGAPPVPGGPPKPPMTPPATKSPMAPPVKKLAPPSVGKAEEDDTPVATPAVPASPVGPPSPAVKKIAAPGAPPVKLASPGPPGAPPAKLPTPGAPPVKIATPGAPPVKVPSLQPPGSPGAKLPPPVKKVAPKLNLPEKED